jgi:hypothetical protein
MNYGIKDMLEHENGSKGIATTNHAEYANTDAFAVPSFPVVRGQHLLLDKLEKKRISPKTWYRAIFRARKLELAANQKDRAENKRNRSLKFLQFLENFSGGGVWGGGAGNAEG